MAFALSGKNILIISPQEWGTMRVSKHHYAVELAKRGNTVWFLNPPGRENSIVRHDNVTNLFIVTYKPLFPFRIRFHARRLFDLLMRGQIAMIRRRLDRRLDVVWCFDSNLYSSLRSFGAARVVYHVVDQLGGPHALLAARDADLILSVAPEILARFDGVGRPRLLVNHGLGEDFAQFARRRLDERAFAGPPAGRPQLGYVGNLLIPSLDRRTVLEVVEENPAVDFHFWGACSMADSNVSGDASPGAAAFVASLRARPNVTLHGVRPPARLAGEIQPMDAFWVCYDLSKDPNGGYNTHKMLEYLSTGKVVICNRIAAYQPHAALIRMSHERDNGDFPRIFRTAMAELPTANAPALQEQRIALALKNTYASHIDEIAAALAHVP